jgi:hypothetical protein
MFDAHRPPKFTSHAHYLNSRCSGHQLQRRLFCMESDTMPTYISRLRLESCSVGCGNSRHVKRPIGVAGQGVCMSFVPDSTLRDFDDDDVFLA